MSRRDRQRAELQNLCRNGAVGRAVDLAFTHFADFGRDEDILAVLAEALDRVCATAAVRRRFAELHGGRAWVEDREGGGASFRVWIPDGAPQHDPTPATASPHEVHVPGVT